MSGSTTQKRNNSDVFKKKKRKKRKKRSKTTELSPKTDGKSSFCLHESANANSWQTNHRDHDTPQTSTQSGVLPQSPIAPGAKETTHRIIEFVYPRSSVSNGQTTCHPFVFGKKNGRKDAKGETTEDTCHFKLKGSDQDANRTDLSLDEILSTKRKKRSHNIAKRTRIVEKAGPMLSCLQNEEEMGPAENNDSNINKTDRSKEKPCHSPREGEYPSKQNSPENSGGTKQVIGLHQRSHNGPSDHCHLEEQNHEFGRQLSGLSVEDAVRDKHGCRPRSNSTDAELNLPRRGLCDEHFVLESHMWRGEHCRNKVPAPPRGLVNLGNTCFLNATLQCLSHLPTFCQCVAALPASPPKKCNDGSESGGKKISNGQRITLMLRALLHQIHNLKGGDRGLNGQAIAPRAVVKAVPTLGGTGRGGGHQFRPGRQEDAHEFLVHLLDAMKDGELKAAGIDQRQSGWRDRLPIPRLDETTLIHRIFGGYLRSQVSCARCGHSSNTYDPFLDLALEVSNKTARSVASAFSLFTRKETLDSANRWKCSGCKKHVCASKQLTVFRPPLSLCIQLKRFTYSGSGGFGGLMHDKRGGWGYGHYPGKGMGTMGWGGSKIGKPIEFPATLSLPLSDGRKCEYVLTGVVIHVGGTASSGHYTSYVKKPGSGGTSQWYHMDDSFVEAVSEKRVLKQKDAYVLFYCRREVKLEFPSPPPRGFMSASEAKSSGVARAKARAEKKMTNTNKKQDAVGGQPMASPVKSAQSQRCKQPTPSDAPRQDTPSLENARVTFLDSKASKQATNDRKEKGLIASPIGSASAVKKTNVAEDSSSALSSSSPESSSDSGDIDSCIALELNHVRKSLDSAMAKTEESNPLVSTVKGNTCSSPDTSEGAKCDLNSLVAPNSAESKSTMTRAVRCSTPIAEKKSSVSPDKRKGRSAQTKARIVLDCGPQMGNVGVVVEARNKSNAWKPKSSLSEQNKEGGNELLGAFSVAKWDDEEDVSRNRKLHKKRQALLRERVAKDVENKIKSRKRKMVLDRWDAMLDEGKTKKVKLKQPDEKLDLDPKHNPFHRIQSSMQKINRGSAKGYKPHQSLIIKRGHKKTRNVRHKARK